MEKILLTDLDGCAVKWNEAFDAYMHEHGYSLVQSAGDDYDLSNRYGVGWDVMKPLMHEFSTSAHIANLEPFPGAVEYLNEIDCAGYKIIAITSIGDDPLTVQYRKENLLNTFGDIFHDVIHLPCGAHKADTLAQWKDTGRIWVEDYFPNALAGHNLGLNTVLITHPWNEHKDAPFPRVDPANAWETIYNLLLENS